jgi:hypothetical protein
VNSVTSGNLRRVGKITFAIIDGRVAYYVKAAAIEIAGAMRSAGWNAAFDCRVEQVLADGADDGHERGAYVTGGVTCYQPQREADLERAAVVLAELRAPRAHAW